MAPNKRSRGGAKSLKDNFPLFMVLDKTNKNVKQRNKLINSLSEHQMKGVEHLANNFLQKKYNTKGINLNKLKKDRKFIYNLAKAGTSLATKKKILKQKGGILHMLLPLALGGLMGGGRKQVGGILPFLPAIASKLLIPLATGLAGKIAEPLLNKAVDRAISKI